MPEMPGLARQRQQPAFNQILLVCGQIEPGMIPQELTQILILGRGHGWASQKLYWEHSGWNTPPDTQTMACPTGIKPTSANLSAMMSLSKGFMMYSLAPPLSA